MFIFKDTLKRANENAAYVDAEGTKYSTIPRELLTEIPEPRAPADYSVDLYYRTEQEDAPYVVYEPKPPEQVAAVRWAKIKAIRDYKLQHGGCMVAGKWFHSDTHSKLQQLSLLIAGANLPAGIPWKTMDGSFLVLTPLLVSQLCLAQMQREQSIFTVSEAKRLDSSDVNAGWPEVYSVA